MIRKKLIAWLESKTFQHSITAIIILNAIVLGLETSSQVMAQYGGLLKWIDSFILIVFFIEISLRVIAQGWRFFTDSWNVFDFFVVAIALAPDSGPFAVLRALRILRVLRLVSIAPSMRAVVSALLQSLPGMGAIVALLMLIFYVSAVMATTLFGKSFPQWFGSLGDSFYTLFQIMTLESWSMGIVRPVMETYSMAWIFFVPFILIATFTMLNLFIAVVVNAMQTKHEMEQGKTDREVIAEAHDERELLHEEIRALRAEIKAIALKLNERNH